MPRSQKVAYGSDVGSEPGRKVKMEQVEEMGSLDMMANGRNRRSSRMKGTEGFDGYVAQYRLSEMRPKAMAELVKPFSLPELDVPS